MKIRNFIIDLIIWFWFGLLFVMALGWQKIFEIILYIAGVVAFIAYLKWAVDKEDREKYQ